MLIAFNKPFGVLSQFSGGASSHRTLAEFGFPKNVYPLGRLDVDSEGLLLLSDEAGLNSELLHPKRRHPRTYWCQVEGKPSSTELQAFEGGIWLQGIRTLPCRARLIETEPIVPKREPPIRERKNIPVSWIEIELCEGKNRQVRRMTAAIGFPTLRLIRVRIGQFALGDLLPGKWKDVTDSERERILSG